MPDFHRTFVNDRSFIRGAARILVAPTSTAKPTKISDVIRLVATAQNEVQTITITGTPTGGTFTLSFNGATTGNIAFNATNATVQTALQGLSTIGSGNATVTGGPGPATPYVVTFVSALAGTNTTLIYGDASGLTGGTTPAIGVVETTAGFGQYDAATGWTDLGATKTGIQISINNAEESFDVDQIMGDIASQPTNWEVSVGTQLAEVTPERLQLAWEGSAISNNALAGELPEQEIGFGNPVSYTERRLAVLFQRPNGKIRGHFFWKAQRMPQESSVTFAKTGEQISIPVRFKIIADTSVTDPNKRFFIIRDQQVA